MKLYSRILTVLFFIAAIIATSTVFFVQKPIQVQATALTELHIDTVTSTGVWTAPAGVTSINVEAWGAGGGGTSNVGGGGGGAYVSSTVSVTPGNVYYISVGTSTANVNGTASMFATTTVLAAGGWSGANNGLGGAIASSTGDTKYAGGNGTLGTGIKSGGGSAGDSASASGASPGATNGSAGTAINPGVVMGSGGGSNTATQAAGGRGEVRITYVSTASDGFPAVVGRSWGRDTVTSTTHPITMPSNIQVGDLLVILFSSASTGTQNISSGGWTNLGQAVTEAVGNNANASVFWKIATGGDTATVTTQRTNLNSHIVYRISGASGISGSTSTALVGSPDPPTHTPSGGSSNYLWIASFVSPNGVTSLSPPANYSSLLQEPGFTQSGSAITVSSQRELSASSDDPGVFVIPSTRWAAWTLAVSPTPSVSTPSAGGARRTRVIMF